MNYVRVLLVAALLGTSGASCSPSEELSPTADSEAAQQASSAPSQPAQAAEVRRPDESSAASGTSVTQVPGATSQAAQITDVRRPQVPAAADSKPDQQALSAAKPEALIIDVRAPAEYARGHIDGAINIPHDQIGRRLSALPRDRSHKIVIYCRTGRRSTIAAKALTARGYKNVVNARTYKDLRERMAREPIDW